jgi:hypothetical protein
MLQWPDFGVWKMIYLLLRMRRKPQLISLNFCYTLSIVHFKVCIRIVTWTYPISLEKPGTMQDQIRSLTPTMTVCTTEARVTLEFACGGDSRT